jgi:hypothetical protein
MNKRADVIILGLSRSSSPAWLTTQVLLGQCWKNLLLLSTQMQKALEKSQADSESLPSKLVGFSTTELRDELFCQDKAPMTVETKVLRVATVALSSCTD